MSADGPRQPPETDPPTPAARPTAKSRGGDLHARFVFGRRVRRLAAQLTGLLPRGARILDVGCGDGTLDALILRDRPDVTIHGVEVLVRLDARIPVEQFDGSTIPHPAASFDVVLFVDVLHHTRDPLPLLREAKRVAGDCIVIKDHLREGVLAEPTLRFMDWFGNHQHGVALPYHYLSAGEWRDAFTAAGLDVRQWSEHVGLYPWPASLLFDRRLHVIAQLTPQP